MTESSKRISKDMLPEIVSDLAYFSVPLFGARLDRSGEINPFYAGSGTLVSFEKEHFVLTATHVCQEVFKSDGFGLSLKSDEKPIVLKKDYLQRIDTGKRNSDEWGPDLAFVRLPQDSISRVQECKVFFNLEKRRKAKQEPIADVSQGIWVTIGAAAEQSDFLETEAVLNISSFFSSIRDVHENGGYDYYDINVDAPGDPDVPRSFGGVSGGGLWHVTRISSTGTASQWEYCLEGVAFYEKIVAHGQGYIRCHGRRSVYIRGLSLLEKKL